MSPNAQLTTPVVDILIAEDSPTQAQRLQRILERQGYQVTHAADGRQAFEAARRHKPTLILSDVVMPVMDGYELCRQVKSDAALSDIPVVLVTTLSDPQDVIRGLVCGADNFILKPYDDRQLLSRVQFILLNREVRQSERAGMGVDVFFNGQKHFITADRLQILNLLLSTYEAAIEKNKELSRTQEELRLLNARLEAANKELESFSYSVSHDLRAPLRHIDGFVGLLSQRVADTLDDEGREYLKTISESAKQMGHLIDDLLAFAQMGRAEMMQREVDVESLVQETIRGLTETRGRQIRWKIGSLPRVQADPAMLRQVFVNLLSNAVKYTRPRDAAEIEVGAESAPDEIVFFVRDNGVGFDMQYADKLFGVFQRLHRADEFEGTGVGLANVRRIVARHGGRTWAESKLGEGSVFYFTLPLSQASQL
jgi:two-component system sensor histidine kinase/response regulator